MAEAGLSREGERHLSDRLLDWYDRHARALPWRAPPGVTPDPYRVWLSEIMLQQTTTAAVAGYFVEFMDRWPTVYDLASASLDDVLRLWAGLGYYARARNLHACARAVIEKHGGRFPDREDELRMLPGVGPYTAAAIAAIAFGERAAAVDGNAERVIARYFAIDAPVPDSKPLIASLALGLVPDDRPGDFAQALMDLGATVCTPKRANCLICPLNRDCEGLKRGVADHLPAKREKPVRPVRRGVAFWIEHNGRVLIRRRPEKGLLGGMMEFPSTPWAEHLPADPAKFAPVAAEWSRGTGRVAHTFTHFHLELDIWRARMKDVSKANDCDARFVSFAELEGEALPSVMRKILATVRPADRRRTSRR
jgi:A/G-specific adenine glycosylase